MIRLYPAIKSKMYINNEFKICQFRMKNVCESHRKCPGNWGSRRRRRRVFFLLLFAFIAQSLWSGWLAWKLKPIFFFFLSLPPFLAQGGGGGYSGGDTYKSVMNGEGGTSYIGSKRSIADLSFIYAGDNIGHGSVVIVPALPHPACGCDYRCVAIDEFSVNVRCICPDGWRLKKDNQTACERKSKS